MLIGDNIKIWDFEHPTHTGLINQTVITSLQSVPSLHKPTRTIRKKYKRQFSVLCHTDNPLKEFVVDEQGVFMELDLDVESEEDILSTFTVGVNSCFFIRLENKVHAKMYDILQRADCCYRDVIVQFK